MKTTYALALAAALAGGAAAAEETGLADDWTRIYMADEPSVSPDGTEVVFEWCGRIWRGPVAGGVASPLTADVPADDTARWAPDGSRIVYTTQRDGYKRIYEIPLDVNGAPQPPRAVTSHSEGMGLCGFAPDGRVAIVAHRDCTPEARINSADSRRPYLVAANGAEELIFDSPASEIAISPDGKKVLFATTHNMDSMCWRKRRPGSFDAGNSDIWLYDIESKTFSAVAETDAEEREPVWTPQGDGFYFTSNADGGVANIWYRPLTFKGEGRCKAGRAKKLTSFADSNAMQCSLSADGRTLVFRQGFDLRAIDPTADDIEVRTIWLKPSAPVAPGTRQRAYAGIDNDYGRGNCAFTADGDVAVTAGGDIYVVGVSHREPVLVAGSSRTHERDCAFSPDCDVLYWLSDKGDCTEIWAAERKDPSSKWTENTKFKKRLVLGGDGVQRRMLSVSPKGDTLAWTDLAGRFHFSSTNGEEKAVAAVGPCRASDCRWSPDGKYIAATLADCHANLDVWIIPSWAKDADGADAPAPYNLSRNFRSDSMPAWSPDGRIIAFCGERAGTDGKNHILYAYLDPADEASEMRARSMRRKKPVIDFDGLCERVHDTGVEGEMPFFSHDRRTLMFNRDGKTWRMKLPLSLEPEELFKNEGTPLAWKKGAGGGDMVFREVEGFPAFGDQLMKFVVFKTIDVADYQELCFLSAWADVRDTFCDEKWHGTDWPAVRGKYLDAARNAPSWTVFGRVLAAMYGEIDASHFDFSMNEVSRKRWGESIGKNTWRPDTASLGVRFDPAHKGKGWLVKDVIPGSPADAGSRGLKPGDVVLAIDGREVEPGDDYATAVNNNLPHKYKLSIRRDGEKDECEIEGIDFKKARTLLREAAIAGRRRRCHAENIGYISIDAFDEDAAGRIADELFAEGEGRGALVIDVRNNIGGHTADKLIEMLCTKRHDRAKMRGTDGEGFVYSRLGRPVFPDLPVVAVINAKSVSNAEEFAHAMRTFGRGRLVGERTAGQIVGTTVHPLFDYGSVNRPSIGFFLPDGTDMEWHGAEPDVEVEMTPADFAAGRDPQLDAAIEEAKKLAKKNAKRKLPELKFSR